MSSLPLLCSHSPLCLSSYNHTEHRGARRTEPGGWSGAPPPPTRLHGPSSRAAVLTSLHNGRLVAGTYGQHFEHAAGGPEQLLITVVAHDLDEGLGSSIGQDDELLGEGEMSVRQMGSLARNKDGREGR